MADPKKTAVILIHGIGEQRPMSTLWSFINAAWLNDPDLVEQDWGEAAKAVYSKPGLTPDNLELRRIATRKAKGTTRTFDFYEYYWAHLLLGNTLGDILVWLKELFWRSPTSLPRAYWGYWGFGWALVLGGLGLYLAWSVFCEPPEWLTWPWLTGLGALIPFAAGLIVRAVVPVAGDAARYLRASPRNVEARQNIRAGGLALVERLTRSGDYDRIVMVGHSLGSVVAYDILTHAWAGLDEALVKAQHGAGTPLIDRLDDLEEAGAALFELDRGEDGYLVPVEGSADIQQAYREAQQAYARELAAQNRPLWLVSDLVTLGSPLGKADLLLAEDPEAFRTRKKRREYPTAPPFFEYWAKDTKRFSYPRDTEERIPHHAALFAPCVWSNVYFPARLLVLGDPVAGACAPHFGPGVKDTRLANSGLRFQHCDYWLESESKVAAQTIAALRGALNLTHRTPR